jgi:DNA repair protein RadC
MESARQQLCARENRGALGDVNYVIPEEACRVADIPESLRPREAMTRMGAENVSNEVLLAVLLRGGTRGVNVCNLARGLLRRYGSLSRLAAASVEELTTFGKGLGPVKAQALKAALELGRRLQEEAVPPRHRVRTPQDAVQALRPLLQGLQTEVFWVLLLDAKNFLRCRPVAVSQGVLDASLVHPREVFRHAVLQPSAAVVLAHNHPSGDPTPSAEDIRITRQLVQAGRVMDIRVLDHVVIGHAGDGGGNGFVSLREEGLVEFGGL